MGLIKVLEMYYKLNYRNIAIECTCTYIYSYNRIGHLLPPVSLTTSEAHR